MMKISWSLNMWNKFWESKRVKMSYFWKMLFIWLPEGDDCGKVFSVLRDFEIHWRDHIHLGEKYYTWESWEQSIKIEILSSMSNISKEISGFKKLILHLVYFWWKDFILKIDEPFHTSYTRWTLNMQNCEKWFYQTLVSKYYSKNWVFLLFHGDGDFLV